MERDSKLYITGRRGLVDSAIVRRLTALGYTNLKTKKLSHIFAYRTLVSLILAVAGCLFCSSCYGESVTGKINFPYLQDFNPGFSTSWFLSKKNNLTINRNIQSDDSIFGILRLKSRKKSATFQLDHIPLRLVGGEYTLSLVTRSNNKNNKVSIELIRMKSDLSGKFLERYGAAIDLGGDSAKAQIIRFSEVLPGDYILRFNGYLPEQDSYIDFSNFNFTGNGLAASQPEVQFAPSVSDVLFFPKQHVDIAGRLYLAREMHCTVSVKITDEQGNEIAKNLLGSFNGAGVYNVTFTFIPQYCGFYIVNFELISDASEQFGSYYLQKSFSVVPGGDNPFMGLHCNGPDRNREELVLGRKAGFTHYRDHDFGAFTRWSLVQSGNNNSNGTPPSFNWQYDSDISFIVENLGYNYLGVLFSPPDWAQDKLRSRDDYPIHVPMMNAWRNYVHEVVQRYSVEKHLIREWEVWNEGKGVIGENLNDHSIYLELLQNAEDEITSLTKKDPQEHLKIVAFGGIDRENIWRKVLPETKNISAASIHWKALRYRDTYFPVQRLERIQDERLVRDGWPKRAKLILQEYGDGSVELWDSEGGLLNQNSPIYTFSSPDPKQFMIIANRQEDVKYNAMTSWNYGPVDPLEGASIMAKQVVAHLSAGIKRLYMYSFVPRDFVSSSYAPHMLEYDGTLKAYSHAFVISAKMLSDLRYICRDNRDDGLVCENFSDGAGKTTAACWNEREGLIEVFFPTDSMVYSMMGSPIPRPLDGKYSISTNPVYVTFKSVSPTIKKITILKNN